MKRLALALAFCTVLATPALAGPPWITIEIKPFGGMFLIARTFHHGTPQGMALIGTAEGLVGGQRRSVPLRFDRTDVANAFAVPASWGTEGVWVLNIVTREEHGGAGAVVGVDRAGTAAFVRFPRDVTGISRGATRGEIDAMLRALEAGQQPAALGSTGWFFVAVRVVLPLLVLTILVLGAFKGLRYAVRRVRTSRIQGTVIA